MPEQPPFLLYLGPLRPSKNSNAERIGELIANKASDSLPGTYLVTKMPAAKQFAGRDGVAITDPSGQQVLYVVDVPFHDELGLDNAGEPKDRAGLVRSFISSTWFVLVAVSRWRKARKRGSKSPLAKRQLAVGLMMITSLVLLALFGAVAVVVALWPHLLPDAFTQDDAGPHIGFAFLGGSITLGALIAFVRGRAKSAGRLSQRLLSYVEDGQVSKEIANVLEQAIDSIDDLTPAGEPRPTFHVLGYSFGSILALDALFPPNGAARGLKLAQVSSLATVGCPADFVRLYYPGYYDDRQALPVLWHNLYIRNDVLGSNFLDSVKPEGGRKAAVPVESPVISLQPTESIAFGTDALSTFDLLKREGFTMHARYWDESDRTSIIDVLMPLWPPLKPAQD